MFALAELVKNLICQYLSKYSKKKQLKNQEIVWRSYLWTDIEKVGTSL